MSGDIDKAVKILTEAGIPEDDARFDIGVIFSYLGDEADRFDEAVHKRASGMPVAYVIGQQAFYTEEYKVTQDVLIPRADTELLVESALQFLGELKLPIGDVGLVPMCPLSSSNDDNIGRDPRLLDLCTGTGCVGISIFNHLYMSSRYRFPEAVLTDVSEKAMEVARLNVGEVSVAPSYLKVMKLDVLTEELPEDIGVFDVITANPPYINSSDMEALDAGVKDFEPELALRGGDDGLIFYPHICNIALRCLREGGALIVEHGYDQGEQVAQILTDKGLCNVKTLKDFGGNDRVTFGIR
ncbi:MAG: peptide chain release factor N(5)-glutamine methyltransferase [Clostridiales bacterium]|nr:peptide chain release factor N(5)-glutamine methyltransferase [Clostridiales bacterium]